MQLSRWSWSFVRDHLFRAIKIVPQGREYTVERFGRYTRTLKPGISFLTPFVEGVGRGST